MDCGGLCQEVDRAIDVFVVDCDHSTLMVESGDMITIHPVLQYYDVIAQDMLVIGAIV